jgi:hypothetical protein
MTLDFSISYKNKNGITNYETKDSISDYNKTKSIR